MNVAIITVILYDIGKLILHNIINIIKLRNKYLSNVQKVLYIIQKIT